MAKATVRALADHVQRVWIDYPSPPLFQAGVLARMVERGMVGVASNTMIVLGAIAKVSSWGNQVERGRAEEGAQNLSGSVNEWFPDIKSSRDQLKAA